MSDFLSRLVDRSVAATGSVRPQLLSIFEPPAPNGAQFSTEIESLSSPAVEQPREPSSDRFSRLQSLWCPASPESARQFVAAPSKPGSAAFAQSIISRDASPHLQPRIDPPAKQPNETQSNEGRGTLDDGTGDEEAGALPTQFPGVASPAPRPVDVLSKQQSGAAPKESRGPADAGKTNQDSADSSRPVLASVSQRIRPNANPNEQLNETVEGELRDGPAAAVTSERRDASRPEPLRASTEIRSPVELAAPAIDPRPTVNPVTARAATEATPALQPQLHSRPALVTPSSSEPMPADAIRNRPRALRSEKGMELTPGERESHRKLTSGRDVRAISPRPVSLRFDAPAQRPGSPPVAPTINVTIGRIEVRATPPPRAPAPAPRPPAPVMSLDEYLRQRAGGNRR
jgi:hypothetical protein